MASAYGLSTEMRGEDSEGTSDSDGDGSVGDLFCADEAGSDTGSGDGKVDEKQKSQIRAPPKAAPASAASGTCNRGDGIASAYGLSTEMRGEDSGSASDSDEDDSVDDLFGGADDEAVSDSGDGEVDSKSRASAAAVPKVSSSAASCTSAAPAAAAAEVETDWVGMLRSVFDAAQLSASHMAAFIARLEDAVFAPGKPIVRQGEIGDRCFIILSGEVTVEELKTGGDEPTVLTRLYAGQHFGEYSLLKEQPRLASVIARGSELVRVKAISRAAFRALVDADPGYGAVVQVRTPPAGCVSLCANGRPLPPTCPSRPWLPRRMPPARRGQRLQPAMASCAPRACGSYKRPTLQSLPARSL